jgi:hypothetical protein
MGLLLFIFFGAIKEPESLPEPHHHWNQYNHKQKSKNPAYQKIRDNNSSCQ